MIPLFFKKKKNDNPLITFLEERLEEARRRNERSFYYPLREAEVVEIRDYFRTHHNTIVEISHFNGNTKVYKFYGYDI